MLPKRHAITLQNVLGSDTTDEGVFMSEPCCQLWLQYGEGVYGPHGRAASLHNGLLSMKHSTGDTHIPDDCMAVDFLVPSCGSNELQ